MVSPLMAAAKRFPHLQFRFVAALVIASAFSAPSWSATTLISLQVSVLVQNACSAALTPTISTAPAVPGNLVKVNCQYGQAYTVDVEPAAAGVGPGPIKTPPQVSGNVTIVTVTY